MPPDRNVAAAIAVESPVLLEPFDNGDGSVVAAFAQIHTDCIFALHVRTPTPSGPPGTRLLSPACGTANPRYRGTRTSTPVRTMTACSARAFPPGTPAGSRDTR